MRSTLVLLGLILAATTTPVNAQVLRGRITDAESGLRLRAAEVVLLDEQTQEVARATTDTTGVFALRASRAGGYRMRISLLGYTTVTSEPINLRDRETVEVAVRLSTQAIPLAPVVVTARRVARGQLEEFEKRRQRQGTGHFLTREEIDRRPVTFASWLVLNVPRATLLSGKIMLPGSGTSALCRANVYVDGILMQRDVDDFLIPDWVGGVEVYPRSTHAPVEYRGDNPDCGVVLFWTREPERGGGWNWMRIAVSVGFAAAAVLLVR